VIPLKEAKGHLKRASTSHKRECGKRYGSRDLCVRNPRSTLSAGKPRTWGRGNARKSARGHLLTKVPRVGVIELSVERGA
jgi:hypothetical protein